MKIISGQFKGINLSFPDDIRPFKQSDKKIIFDTIRFDLPGAKVADLYAGSGQIGLEAISNGARQVTFVEKNETNLKFIQQNIELCSLNKTQFKLVSGTVPDFIAHSDQKFNLIIADPPHFQVNWPDLALMYRIAEPNAILIVKYDEKNPPPDWPQFHLIKTKGSRDNRLNFYLRNK